MTQLNTDQIPVQVVHVGTAEQASTNESWLAQAATNAAIDRTGVRWVGGLDGKIYRGGRINGSLRIDIWWRIHELHHQKMSIRKIQRRLRDEGVVLSVGTIHADIHDTESCEVCNPEAFEEATE